MATIVFKSAVVDENYAISDDMTILLFLAADSSSSSPNVVSLFVCLSVVVFKLKNSLVNAC